MRSYALVLAVTLCSACSAPAPTAVAVAPAAAPPALVAAEGADVAAADEAIAAFEIPDTEVRHVHSAALGRSYPVFVALPHGYDDAPERRYPVVFITDTTYAFPLVRSISRMVGDKGAGLEDFILVGLGYANGETSQFSRRRDYTPTERGPDSALVSDMPGRAVEHGGAEAYRRFIRDEVFPLVAAHYRVDMERKIFAGHSYGALLGTHALLTEPEMFDRYILSSPSLWYDGGAMFAREREYAQAHADLPASVFLSIGALERGEEDMVGDTARVAAALRAHRWPGLQVEAIVIPDEGHLSVYPVAITRGLRWALPPREG